ncbi:hypothetical protein L1987_51322 [Smallanthus sonchifolius]|uniref:Uncharacterized protein n=1 Tax=Smallanthus sonchifolius TaxID=185202 RepID=A0ACB9EQ37_9ASTR|nr:hypothetical protein L1987_51322 [Smallanthus sonchifolius]
MEWTTVQHLDLRHVGRSSKPFQPHAAAFHPSQTLIAVAAGTYVTEFDAYTGSKISSINIGAPAVRMSYSLTSGHAVIAILEDCTIRSCDFDTEQTWVLHSPEKKMERITVDTEVYLALTPLQPVVFFGFHCRMSVTVVGTVEGGRAPTKIKADMKKPIVNLACHPRLAVLYVAYADGLIRAYNIHTYAVLYTLQLDNTIKLIGAGAFAFHPTLEWIFVGDRRGTLLAWDVSTERPIMIGITQVSSQPIISVAWLPMLRILVTLSKDGTLHVWKTRVVVNSNRPGMQSNFFDPADLIDSFKQNMTGGDNARNKAAYTREGRKQLFAVLQSARGSSASALKEKLQALGSSGILAEHQLQAQLQEHHMKGIPLTYHFMEGHAKSAPISRLPLITILDTKNYLKDIPVCQPIHLELNFFSKENRVLHYPTRTFYIEGVNLMAYNLSTGAETVYKKLFASMPGHVEFHGKYLLHSRKQHLFLIVYEFNGASSEVVLYWENTSSQSSNSKANTIKGSSKPAAEKNMIDDQKQYEDLDVSSIKGPLQFTFESEVDRIFSTPVESTLMFACFGDKIGMAKLVHGYSISTSDGPNLSTKGEGKKSIKLKASEIVLQVHWQETLRGSVAGILTTQRIYSLGRASPYVLHHYCNQCAWMGWDGKVRTILSSSMPNAVLVGTLNDRLLLANPTEINSRQKKGMEIKHCLVGLLEPLLIGYGTMQQNFEQKLDLSEILYQITSRFDSLRITPRSLDILATGAPVCGDLAVLRGSYAIKARRFSTALSVLNDEFLRSRDYPQCPPTSHLFHRFRQLGYACIKYGQFDSAKETFEAMSDYESLLDLFICHLNPSAMRRLAQRLEEENADSELRRYCERILRVRSTGWTQGIFANFAAESMVPKGPEWGGGDWEIKTPSTTKSIPQWELAAAVMPYMRTDDGSIPLLSTDHIGVYLGLIKGRGNVVEVSDNSLVKAYKSDGSSAADEQAKAEEEFKKSLYGTAGDDISSDEEGDSKAKKWKISIRDKPAANATVDVDKIKEATKQFKLGDALGAPIYRTKSLTNQFQELSLNTPQPAVSTPVDPFGTNSFTQTGPVFPAGPMPTGAAVGPQPIPEDFFQNTIPSLQVAAALPPPGTYLSRYDQNSQANNVLPNQVASSAPNVSGTPLPQVPMQPVSTESFGLPDGGVPPQSMSQPVAIMPPSSSVQVSTQPLDLSLLEGPGSVNAAKPTEPPPPTFVRPGQVPRGAAASVCFKTGLVHLEQNQLSDALSCFDEAFLALAKDNSRGADIKAQATICAQYKVAVTLLQEIGRLQKVQGASAISAKD